MSRLLIALLLLALATPARAAAIFNGTSTYATIASAVASGAPIYIFAWIKPAETTSDGVVFNIGNASSGAHLIRMYVRGASNDTFEIQSAAGGAAASANTVSTYTSGTWQAISGYTLGSSRSVQRNALGFVTPETTNLTPTLDMTQIGARLNSGSPGIYFAGRMERFAVWKGTSVSANVANFPTISARLNAGIDPRYVGYLSSSDLVIYKQFSSQQNETGDVSPGFTYNNFTYDGADHAPVLFPPWWVVGAQ